MPSLAYSSKEYSRTPKKPYYIIIVKPEHSNEIVLKAKVDADTFHAIQNVIKAYTWKEWTLSEG